MGREALSVPFSRGHRTGAADPPQRGPARMRHMSRSCSCPFLVTDSLSGQPGHFSYTLSETVAQGLVSMTARAWSESHFLVPPVDQAPGTVMWA